MSQDFLNRAQLLQDTVLTYFASYPAEAVVVPRSNLPGVFDVELSGQLAARFDSVSAPIPGGNGQRHLRLVFHRDYAAIAPGYELVAPGSPVLRIMQNDLAEQASYTRSAVAISASGTLSDFEAFGIEVRHARPSVRCRYLPRRYYLLRYLVRLTSYEKTEDIVPLVVDAAAKTVQAEADAAPVVQATLLDWRTAAYQDELSLPAPDPGEVRAAVALADQAVQDRLRDALRDRCAELAVQLGQELERIDRHFENEVKNASPAERQEMERVREHKAQELRDRYAVRTEVTLLSVQEIVAPRLEYNLLVGTGAKAVVVPQHFFLDPLAPGHAQLQTKACRNCSGVRQWAYCSPGNHLECVRCGTVRKCIEATCDTGVCGGHAVHCADASCRGLLCPAHQRACRYCSATRRYCAGHIGKSFEGRDICPECATPCAKCARVFPAAPVGSRAAGPAVLPCVVCARKFCPDDRSLCPSCGKPHCAEHGSRAHGHPAVYCEKCLDSCSACPADVRHLRSELLACKEGSESLCRDHAVFCEECGDPLCDKHVLRAPAGTGCKGCFAPCDTCSRLERRRLLLRCHVCDESEPGRHCPEHTCVACQHIVCMKHVFPKPIRLTVKQGGALVQKVGHGCVRCFSTCRTCSRMQARTGLRGCHLCPAGDEGLHCADHWKTCILCGAATCDKHRVALQDGSPACARCADACSHCGAFYPRVALVSCLDCKAALLPGHAIASQFRPGYYCAEDGRKFASCAGCGRRGPAPQLRQCQRCSVRYCPHCIAASATLCQHCGGATVLPPGPRPQLDAWVKAVATAPLDARSRKELAAALGPGGGGYVLTCATSKAHVILHGVYRGGLLRALTRPFHRVKEFVLVGEPASGTINVRVNP